MKAIAFAGLALAALLLGSTAVSAKTVVYCSEGSPENFYPGVNTTGTSFDANEPIYDRLVGFERGGTKVVPGLADVWILGGTNCIPGPPRCTSDLRHRNGTAWYSDFGAEFVGELGSTPVRGLQSGQSARLICFWNWGSLSPAFSTSSA